MGLPLGVAYLLEVPDGSGSALDGFHLRPCGPQAPQEAPLVVELEDADLSQIVVPLGRTHVDGDGTGRLARHFIAFAQPGATPAQLQAFAFAELGAVQG